MMRFFLLDKITMWKVGQEARGFKSIALSEDFFDDHFPRHPIMPGVLIIEAMAQLGGLLLEATCERDHHKKIKAVLTIVENIKFRNMARPGDTLELSCSIISSGEDFGRIKCRATVDGKRIADGNLIFAYLDELDEVLEAKRSELLDFWMEEMEA